MNKGISRNITRIVILSLIISLFLLNSIDFVKGGNTTITTDEPVIVSFSNTKWGYKLHWFFECDNESIGIKVEFLDEANFLKYNTSQSYESIVLSDGTHFNDSGSYQTKYRSSYYVIYSINEIYDVTDPIAFYHSTGMWITLLFFVFGTPFVLGPLCLILFVVGLVSFVKWRDKKKIQAASENNVYSDVGIDTVDAVFCGQCGAKNKSTQNFCVKCGSSLIHDLM